MELGLTQQTIADAFQIARPSVTMWELNRTRPEIDKISKLAELLKCDPDWLLSGTHGPEIAAPSLVEIQPNGTIDETLTLDSIGRIPVYGQAIGGSDGNFILNGNHITDVLAPPSLKNIRGAYGVYVVGESMEPRYFAGETVYVNPRLPVRRNDFVVVQIVAGEGDPPHGYIKRFVRQTEAELTLDQFNPPKEIKFPRNRVVSVHRIVMGGDA